MEQTIEQRLRELLIMQLGSQVLQMCELQAQLDTAKAQIVKWMNEDEKKAGVSAS